MSLQTRDDKGDDLDHTQDISQSSSSSVITEDLTDDNDSTVRMAVEESYGNRREREKLERLKYREDLNELDDYISKLSVSHSDKTDIQLWIPPEPECTELDIDSVADNDDDEYCDDGTVWGQPSSLNSLEDEFGNNHSIKEARKKAMLEAMNNQLSILINRLLALEGINVHDNKGSDNWLSVVTCLSWEAASVIEPDASEGGAMDPTFYLKIKCLASGTPNQSQVVKGLVFKKTTAHKHMPTKLKNPRLLLIRGSLGHSSSSLSSFKSMEQEEGYKKTFLEMIDLCNPNVVLVEKTVSRDIQGLLLDKGIALVVDMKISRLERIARATGSLIIMAENVTMVPSLKQCEFFHVEKLIEEHNTAGEDGKKPSKTLMFLEGCPRPLGCTILLKGSHQYELKRIKHVLQYAVFAAYHLVLETSFISDQRTFFYNKNAQKELNYTLKGNSVSSAFECVPAADNIMNSTLDIPVSGISTERSSSDENQSFDEESLQTLNHEQLRYRVSSSMVNLVKNKLPCLKTDSISSCFGVSDTLPHLSPHGSVASDHEDEENEKIKEEKFITEVKIDGKSDYENALDPQSILILVSAYNVPKQMVCEEPHLFRIEYYGNFDTSLGRYLQNNILSEKHICTCCGELPEKHVYQYTHQNGNLSVLVNRLGKIYTLPGEAEGKIWMWTRCLKCEHDSGNPKQTRRVAMSSAAHNLSFGKFLELSFSSRSSDSRISKCGHFLYRDCLRFFGLGTKVALFQYTPVEIYAVCRPPVMLQFCNPSEQGWFSKEASYVISEGERLFEEIKKLLKKLEPKFSSTEIKFSEIEVVLRREKNEFEACLKDTRQNVHANLSWSMQELLLLLYIWDYRLHSFLPNNRDGESSDYRINEERDEENREGSIHESGNDRINQVHRDEHDISSDGDSRPENAVNLESSNRHSTDEIAVSIPLTSDHSQENNSVPVIIGTFDDDDSINSDVKKCFWPTFSELRAELKNDLHGGYLQKYEFVNTYLPAHLSPMRQIATRVKDSLHFLCNGNVISVISDEISSIIACALCLSENNNNNDNNNGDKSTDAKRENVTGSHISSSRSFSSLTVDELAILGSDGSLFFDRGKPVENRHPEISVGLGKGSGKTRYSVVSLYAKEFSHLRSRCCSSEMAYISSLSRCKKWDAQGGKSKALFAKTMDDRFIIKQVKKTELESFLKFGPDYFKYISHILNSGSQSCLAKILGIYQVKQYQNGREFKTDVVIMENLFFGRNITRKYDLKGAVFARYISDSNDSESVFLDENFIQDMRISPIYIGGRNKHLLQRAIWNDTSFLTSINVMDYSLLVGVDKEKREIVFGIIDYLRQYTWDKQLETWVKASLVVPKNELPTVISPKDYRKRFRTFMTKYFLTIPDSWEENQDKVQNIT